jgi:hypothetical protein
MHAGSRRVRELKRRLMMLTQILYDTLKGQVTDSRPLINPMKRNLEVIAHDQPWAISTRVLRRLKFQYHTMR